MFHFNMGIDILSFFFFQTLIEQIEQRAEKIPEWVFIAQQ